ncbi:MAG: hypothetical protein NTZ78_04580 [Candidatus Aureabacteria bacterium]|nr:hypothetical protein [Candidatus Auribacterota bacterium]
MAGAAIEKLLHQAVGIDGRGAAHACGAPVEAEATSDHVYSSRTREAVDGVCAAADFGAGGGGQEAEAQFAQKRYVPFVIGQSGTGLTRGEVTRGSSEFGPVAAQAVPGLSDNFVDALALRQAVVLGPGAGEFPLGIEDTPQQIGRQEPAFGVDSLKVVVSSCHDSQCLGRRI